jgi:putative alpha-1,2-mannosidase
MTDVIFSEAIVKLPHCGSARAVAAGYCVNASALYASSRQNAFVVPVGTPEGRECLTQYIQLGYVPYDSTCDAVVSRTLNYVHGDAAIAIAAELLGETADAAVLKARSGTWRKLINPATGFFAPKTAAGQFLPTFDEFLWGPAAGWTEAGPHQYRVEVPFDPAGLYAELQAAGFDGCDIVQEINTMTSAFHVGYSA